MQLSAKYLRGQIIQPVLKTLGLYNLSAENLLYGTCAQESLMGKYLVQINGPALGIYQIEPETHQDVWNNFLKYRPELADKIKSLGDPCDNELINNHMYSTAIARVIYFRIRANLPAANDIVGLAKYWKTYYNTVLGKGRVQDFIKHYQQFENT